MVNIQKIKRCQYGQRRWKITITKLRSQWRQSILDDNSDNDESFKAQLN
jgi:hypothetical protein